MEHDELIHEELLKVNRSLGTIEGTLDGINNRMDRVEGLYGRVQKLETNEGKNKGYAAGIAATIALIGAVAGFLL